MSPAAKEVRDCNPNTRWNEERLLAFVAGGKMTAHDAARVLTPWYMNRTDSGVKKIEQAAIEDFEFYRDLVLHERKHDRNVLLSSAKNLRRLWDREE